MRRFGSQVTLIDRNANLLHRENENVAEAFQNLFGDEGIDVVLKRADRTDIGEVWTVGQNSCRAKGSASAKALECSHLLVAAGRAPNTQESDWSLPASNSPIADTSR
jgi:pyruvate/2-oxoglutarate dehydrogenase complex dihydrolipoamide dehydrogenase (E3) component